MKSFYSSYSEDCYVFYRQGHGFTIKAQTPELHQCQKLKINDMGSMYLLFDRALITRSSNSILLFKISEETKRWEQYEKFYDVRGQIYFIKGNVRF